MNYENKKVLVLGLAKSGKAAIRVLARYTKEIYMAELKTPNENDALFLDEYGVKYLKQDSDLLNYNFDLVIKNPAVPPVLDLVKEFEKRNIPIITEIELAYSLMKKQTIVAITGTNGKTTTTTLVYELLKQAFKDKALLGGNIGTPLCDLLIDYDLFNNDGYYISLEISNHQLVDIVEFRPDIATIINLTPDHLETMGSLDNYYISKTRVYLNMKDDDLFLLNVDDENIKDYCQRYPIKCNIESFSIENNKADAYIKDDYLYYKDEKIQAIKDIKIIGKHNIQNIIISIMAAKHLGISNEDINYVISNFKGVEHRIEYVKEVNGVKYYNDSKGTNTDATIIALKAFDKNVILLVGGYEKGLDVSCLKPYLGCVKQVIGYGVAGNRIGKDIDENAIIVEDLKQAVDKAYELAQNGDTVLLSPTTSSYDQYNNYEERGRHFKQLVEEL